MYVCIGCMHVYIFMYAYTCLWGRASVCVFFTYNVVVVYAVEVSLLNTLVRYECTVCVHVCMYICMYVYTCLGVRASVCVCACVCAYVLTNDEVVAYAFEA